ncbi:hypothetical protein BO71DRAFT_427479 [Aspergillus ellipticus CBS 707.79]|uniref:Haloacid dehalogenase-like hydrolase n=1 Tax=Aspergillus ellipticus CBS 707.79 TaxID=1448320 RepID=A0A319DHV3_9EURO|nr:hypothetical protein BO71DRAFT_427479 [Aspergillus ellipticus CBS 707.79]
MPRRRTLLLTLDAFDTLFHPHPPVPTQYIATAHRYGLLPKSITEAHLLPAFKTSFKAQSARRPNYGRADVLRGEYGGPRQWWEEVIRGCFAQLVTSTTNNTTTSSSSTTGTQGNVAVPDALIQDLLGQFSGSEGYALYPDVMAFFERLRGVKTPGKSLGVFDRVIVGVVSNSDDRISGVLKSLGVRVGRGRVDGGVLGGFERRELGGIAADSRSGASDGNAVDDIDLLVTSYEAGEEKPSPVIFQVVEREARRLFGDEDGDGQWDKVHVGDDFEKDYRAAVDAGWKGYFLSRGEGSGASSEGVIRSLGEVLGFLEGFK